MRQVRLKTVCRYLIVSLMLAALIGCTEDSTSPDATSGMPGSPATAAAMYGINAQVSYPGAKGSLDEGARVYVFLRKPGTRMPLALQHFPASELPKRVSFTGATQEKDFELVARLSPSGRVDRSPEDIEVSQAVPEFRHPPQNYAMVFGAAASVTGNPESNQAARRADTTRVDTTGDLPSVVIRAAVAIDDTHSFPADTVVFVIARSPGQAMPSVVKRLSLADLPTEIELTDADAMLFNNRLSDAEELDLFARVSTSGTATRSGADWLSDTVHLETARLPELVTLAIGRPSDP